MVNCEICGKEFKPRVLAHVVCSRPCRQEKVRKQYREANPPALDEQESTKLNSGTVGAMHELLACADLMRRGFEVFRAVSPSSPFDMAAFKDGKLIRIEVTTGFYTPAGALIHPKKDFTRFDLLAVVLRDGGLLYKPHAPV
jgi:hypothetical protein